MNPIVGLHPTLVLLALQHKRLCKHEGIEWMMVQGYRTFAEQIDLYEKGRKRTPGGWVITDKKKIVTRGLPESSPHCRRAAYDVAILQDGKIKWSGIDHLYLKVGELGEELGLVWGGRFSGVPLDMDHFEMKNWKELPLEEEPNGLAES